MLTDGISSIEQLQLGENRTKRDLKLYIKLLSDCG